MRFLTYIPGKSHSFDIGDLLSAKIMHYTSLGAELNGLMQVGPAAIMDEDCNAVLLLHAMRLCRQLTLDVLQTSTPGLKDFRPAQMPSRPH